jgi:hypothetical protein
MAENTTLIDLVTTAEIPTKSGDELTGLYILGGILAYGLIVLLGLGQSNSF